MSNSNPQASKFQIVTGASGYRSRSDPTATSVRFLVSGSQNVLVNEATDEGGDKVETRPGYELFGAADSTANKIKSEFRFRTKAGNTIIGRMDNNGDLEYYSEESSAWEILLTGLNGDYPFRTTTAWNGGELIRVLLGVNHSAILYEWSGAVATYASSTAGPNTIVINETIASSGFLTTGSRAIRVKDSGGTWREFTIASQTGSTFTVNEDPTAFTFVAGAIVVQSVRQNSNKPASGYINDTIHTLQNHVYIGSHASSIVYMSQSDDYTDFSFSSPRLPTEGWQFLLDAYNIGFSTNISGSGLESLVMFAENDWIYRVEFNQLGDSSVIETLTVKPVIVSSGQGAKEQELISKAGNAILFINNYNELVDLSQLENITTLELVPLSDPIKPDFLAADFSGGAIRFWRNNLYVTAPLSSRTFILSFRDDERGTRRFWQPPQILPIGPMTDYNGDLIGHSNSVTESYKMFTTTNDNGKPISFKAHFAYNHSGSREKLKNFNTHFTEMYLTSNAEVTMKLLFEYLGAKRIQEFQYLGTDAEHLYIPDAGASLGINSLGTTPLGSTLTEPTTFNKYRRFRPVVPVDHFEYQVRYEMDVEDGRFQILAHGANAELSKNSPANIKK